MIIRDALYGAFEVPQFLHGLISAPEFRRLSDVRLINIDSMSLASLGEVRRYSHTLGVLRLALLNPLMGLDPKEVRAFLASILVHDAGTPAFAHLTEYLLKERYGWDHESAASNLLRTEHHPDQNLHQFYFSQTPAFERLCKNAKVDFEIVRAFISGQHPYSALLFGTVDFDNLDNVARMGWFLGLDVSLNSIKALASNISVSSDGSLILSREHLGDVDKWLEMRRKAYDVLVFDESTVAGQAVLSKAIDAALESGALGLDDWHYTDFHLTSVLMTVPKVKNYLGKDYFGALPGMVLLHQQIDLTSVASSDVRHLRNKIEEFCRSKLGADGRYYGYVFRDRGAFSKKVSFVDGATGEKWERGSRSDSLVCYAFASGQRSRENARDLGREFAAWMSWQ